MLLQTHQNATSTNKVALNLSGFFLFCLLCKIIVSKRIRNYIPFDFLSPKYSNIFYFWWQWWQAFQWTLCGAYKSLCVVIWCHLSSRIDIYPHAQKMEIKSSRGSSWQDIRCPIKGAVSRLIMAYLHGHHGHNMVVLYLLFCLLPLVAARAGKFLLKLFKTSGVESWKPWNGWTLIKIVHCLLLDVYCFRVTIYKWHVYLRNFLW